LVGAALAASATPALAECTFIPPLPKVSFAVASGAHEIFAGTVTDAGEIRNEFQVRVEEVLRGPAAVGDVRRFARLAPNWPWAKSPGGDAHPGCTFLYASPGERVVILLDATSPGMWLEANGQRWYQPPTRFHTIGILEGSSREQYGSGGRQLFSLERLRAMVAELPATDTDVVPVARSSSPVGPLLMVFAGFVAGALAVRRRWSPSMTGPNRQTDGTRTR
jgi:hypothetical protein